MCQPYIESVAALSDDIDDEEMQEFPVLVGQQKWTFRD